MVARRKWPEVAGWAESARPDPVGPYGRSKLACESLGLAMARSGDLPVVVVRSFNLIGPGQGVQTVAGALLEQVRALRGGERRPMQVGNLNAKRDFVDVRDVVRAYAELMLGDHGGGVFNVCSGCAVSIRSLLQLALDLAGIEAEVEIDPARSRAVEVARSCGDPTRLRQAIGWAPRLTLEESLQEMLAA